MKKPSPKTLEAQQKLFRLLGTLPRLRVVSAFLIKFDMEYSELVTATGLDGASLYSALKTLQESGAVKKLANGRYRFNENVADSVDDLLDSAVVASQALNRTKPRVKKTQETVPLYL